MLRMYKPGAVGTQSTATARDPSCGVLTRHLGCRSEWLDSRLGVWPCLCKIVVMYLRFLDPPRHPLLRCKFKARKLFNAFGVMRCRVVDCSDTYYLVSITVMVYLRALRYQT